MLTDGNTASRRPLQFSIRTMLLAVAAAGGLFAVMGAVGPLWSVVLCWFLLLAAAHVAGNAQGTRLRRHTADPTQSAEIPPFLAVVQRRNQPACAPTTLLGQRRFLSRPLWLAATFAGCGGLAAGGLLTLLYFGRVGLSGVAVGAVSVAVLSGFGAYLSASLLEVAMAAIGEARRGSEHAR